MKISDKKTFKDITTFRIGGKISYYIEAKNEDELLKAVSFAKDKKMPVFMVGEGSDFLADDKAYDGTVIRYVGKGIEFKTNGAETYVTGEAGLKWDTLVEKSVKKNLQGIECLSGIPGTVGGAPIQNIGAYGQEISDVFYSLRAFDIENEIFKNFSNKECRFGYRNSIFKDEKYWQKYIITKVTLKLAKNKNAKVNYESLKILLGDRAPLTKIRSAVIKTRKEKLEDPKKFGNAGSFFKNPIINAEQAKKLQKKFPEIKIYPFNDAYKTSAAWLIEKAGWKGKAFGHAAVSPKHALILINKTGRATFLDVYKLSEMIIKDVFSKFGINLEREVQIINHWEKRADFLNKKVAVIGFGIEGHDVVKYLLRQGALITIFDKRPESELDFSDIDKDGIEAINCGFGYLKNGLIGFDFIVRSPGVYPNISELVEAAGSGVKITSAINIFFDKCPSKIIGVTGTKGKGTTSSLIYEILRADDRDVYLAGNIGKPYLELLPQLSKDSYVVMEMSSFQLMDMEKSPNISVVLNITEDHLDWHKNKKEYLEAKKNIVRFQGCDDYAILNGEYESSRNFFEEATGHVVYFSREDLDKKYKTNLKLRGTHNLENIAAAVTACKIIGVDEKIILGTVRDFKGLEHRLELVSEIDGVKYYNDSFATGPQSTMAAINAFTEDETLILGGSDKGLDYDELRKLIKEKDNVKNLILIGDTGEKIGNGIKGKNIINLERSPMIRIVETACEVTKPGGVVLLSPASASFDMFKNYKDRGNQFKSAVANLKSNLYNS